MVPFAHLHLHSQYSLLDGANRLTDVISRVKDTGMSAVAVTDHGNMFGAIQFYEEARKKGVNPIVGIEAYVSQGSMHERRKDQGRNHLVLLARNRAGYQNLLRLTTLSYLEGFYYKPRIDKELLRKHSEGLIGLSACLQGEVNELIRGGCREDAAAAAREYREIFGEGNFYLELQDHGLEEQRHVNEVLKDISRETEIPLVASNDAHYLSRDDSFAHDVLLCIGTQRNLEDPDRLRYAGSEFYIKTPDEMYELFPNNVEALENTAAIAERCTLEIPTGEFHLPEFPVPQGQTLESYLGEVSRQGLEVRLHNLKKRNLLHGRPVSLYKERLESELRVIAEMGFPGYFLIVWDFIRHAREEGIPVGPGRGSAAGSLVSYALRITDVDPLEYDLLFERFLNPERISMPDIDIDFCMRRRGEVIQYVGEKYGRDRVAQIITFGTLAARAVIRDVGRVMGVPYAKVDRIAKMVPEMTRSLAEATEEADSLAAEMKADEEVRQIVEVGTRLEGLTRHASTHAAAVVIAPCPIDELVPLCKTSKDEVLTQWDKDVVENLGLLKMDFLGLKTLTVIDDALRILRHSGVEVDLDHVPLDDKKTFLLFCEGRTSGIFQFESAGMKDLLIRAQPSKFEDLCAFNALYRPGALSVGMVEEFIQRKQGQKKVSYVLPETRKILEETYGVIAYQEQVMQIAVEVGGFTMGEADVLRKAMGKKSHDVMAKQKAKFVSGAEARGVAKRKAQALWDYIEPFAGYGFNKSHSVAYALLAYKTAYLKAHFPEAFMAAMLSSEMSTKDNVGKYIQECREMGIEILGPDVNESDWSFSVVGDSIRFGLGAVKGIGESAVEEILKARQRAGRFKSLAHLAAEVDLHLLNHKVFEALIKSGSFDGHGIHRAALWESLDRILDHTQQRQREKEEGQRRLFGAGEVADPEPDPATEAWPEPEALRFEKEALGFYLTGNPLCAHEAVVRRWATHDTLGLREVEGSVVTVAGVVRGIKRSKIRTGKSAGRLKGQFFLEDQQGAVLVFLFADRLMKYETILREDAMLLVKGNVRLRGSDVEILAEEVTSLHEKAGSLLKEVEVFLDKDVDTDTLLALRDLVIEHEGEVPIVFRLRLPEGIVRLHPQQRFRVSWTEALASSVEKVLGEGRFQEHYENHEG